MKRKLMPSILLAGLMIAACSGRFFESPTCDQPEHNIPSNSSLQLLWSKSNMYVPNDGFSPMIRGLSPRVFLITMPRNGATMISAFDSQTGANLWEQTGWQDEQSSGILTSDSSLYAGKANKIDQYDPETGQLINEIVSPVVVGIINPMYFTEDKIFAFAPGSGRSLTYNVETKEINVSKPLLPYLPFIEESGVLYLSDFEGFEAQDIHTQKVIWKNPVGEHAIDPLFADDVIIIPGSSILNKVTGELIAKLDAHTISNVTQDATRIYFLTEEGNLDVVDKSSGQLIQKISISATPFALPTPDTTVGVYAVWMDSQNKTIVAALGDSCQLVALRLTGP